MIMKLYKRNVCQQVMLLLLLINQSNAREIPKDNNQAEGASIAIEVESTVTADTPPMTLQSEPFEKTDINLEAKQPKSQNRVEETSDANKESQTALPIQLASTSDAGAIPSKEPETKEAQNEEISETPFENDELSTIPASETASDALGQDKQFAGIIDALAAAIIPTTKSPPRKCPDCECGRINTYRKIVGGENTEVNEYPWMTLLLGFGQFFCGGSLINDLYVLTAAHCANRVQASQLTMRFLQYKRETQSMTTIERKAAAILINERYNPRNEDSDIALIRLREPLKFDNLLRPVCLPREGNTYANYEAIVTGWGRTKENGSTADVLQEVRVPIFSNALCRKTSYDPRRITDNMLCAGNLTGGMDSCQGDSGGPLHVNSGSVYEQPGITSWGDGCARPNTPGVYTRVTRYLTWIANRTRDGCYCKRRGGKVTEMDAKESHMMSEIRNE